MTDTFDIANPGEDWQVGCVRIGKMIEKKINDSLIQVTFDYSDALPTRQLVFLETSNNITMIYYKSGGIALNFQVVIIKYDKGNIIDYWQGSGPYDAKNKTEIIQYLKGSIPNY